MTSNTSHSIATLPSKVCHLNKWGYWWDLIYSQVYNLDITHKANLHITHKTQLDITHKLISITRVPSHRVPSMKILDLILIKRLGLILLKSVTIQHHHLNHMRIHKTSYDSQADLILLASQENDSWCCAINNFIEDLHICYQQDKKRTIRISNE